MGFVTKRGVSCQVAYWPIPAGWIHRSSSAGCRMKVTRFIASTSIARPLIAKTCLVVAREVGADAFAHGATGKGNDQCRFQLAAEALDPKVKIIAPWRIERYRQKFPGRTEM